MKLTIKKDRDEFNETKIREFLNDVDSRLVDRIITKIDLEYKQIDIIKTDTLVYLTFYNFIGFDSNNRKIYSIFTEVYDKKYGITLVTKAFKTDNVTWVTLFDYLKRKIYLDLEYINNYYILKAFHKVYKEVGLSKKNRGNIINYLSRLLNEKGKTIRSLLVVISSSKRRLGNKVFMEHFNKLPIYLKENIDDLILENINNGGWSLTINYDYPDLNIFDINNEVDDNGGIFVTLTVYKAINFLKEIGKKVNYFYYDKENNKIKLKYLSVLVTIDLENNTINGVKHNINITEKFIYLSTNYLFVFLNNLLNYYNFRRDYVQDISVW